MSKFQPLKSGILTIFIISALTACGKAKLAQPALAHAQEPAEEQGQAAGQGKEFQATSFVLGQDLSLHPVLVNGAAGTELAKGSMDLPAGTELAVLETREDANGRFVRIGLDADEQSTLPQDFWVSASELPESALVPFVPEDDSGDIEFDALGKRRMTYCYRYVKQYLLQTGKVPVYLPGGSAWMAAGILPRYGFRKLGVGPSGTINGDVCVYSGGRGGNGHIEVKRNGKWWYGYGFIPHPITPVNHRLIGCFRK